MPVKNEHYSNSGIYIFDRYEVQIIDPHQFDLPNGKKGVAKGDDVPHDFRKNPNGENTPVEGPAGGEVVKVSDRNQLLPGGMYMLDPSSGQFKNRANKTKEWNKLEIVFCPPKIDQTDATMATGPAEIEVKLNGEIVWSGPIIGADAKPLKGTGAQGKDVDPTKPRPFLKEGPIFLQSHWGSQVEFRNPMIEALKDCPFDKK